MQNKALGLLGISYKGGNVQIGEEPVGNAAQTGKARLIILASDAADHSVRRARSFASLHETPLIQIEADKDRLGAVFGRTSVAMLTITDIFLAERFLTVLSDDRFADELQAVREKAETMKRRKREKQRSKGLKGKK